MQRERARRAGVAWRGLRHGSVPSESRASAPPDSDAVTACVAALEALLRQHGRVLVPDIIAKVAVIATAGAHWAAQTRGPEAALAPAAVDDVNLLAVSVLVRLFEFGRRIAAEVRRRTRPAARQKGEAPPCRRLLARTRMLTRGKANLPVFHHRVPPLLSLPAIQALERALPGLRIAFRWTQVNAGVWWGRWQNHPVRARCWLRHPRGAFGQRRGPECPESRAWHAPQTLALTRMMRVWARVYGGSSATSVCVPSWPRCCTARATLRPH